MDTTTSNRITMIEQRLRSALTVEAIEILDESDLHIGHAGAASGGGHYQVTIVSRNFNGLRTLDRHRLIYQALGEAMQTEIHALSIKAFGSNQN